jgi:hypothetical protein
LSTITNGKRCGIYFVMESLLINMECMCLERYKVNK